MVAFAMLSFVNLLCAALPLMLVGFWIGSIFIERQPWWWLPVRLEFWLMVGVAWLLLRFQVAGGYLPLRLIVFIGRWQKAIHQVMASIE